ncbi:MAG: NAD(P)/FAD-dependent oxidoreductase, partial [Candidatus Heimdallarchaeota archaeon]|nr:NAD(P)/FAD-dependent oxidoreductase [Candidatus Heimdallarchaeota archaeon]
MDYELIIVGGGPAGLSAALTAAYFKLKTVIIESASAGGALINQYPWKKVDNYLGFFNLTGAEVAKEMVDHVKTEGVEIKENEMITDRLNGDDSQITVRTTKGEYKCNALILAIGLGVPRKLDVPGVTLDGVIYSLPEPEKYKGKNALVIGGGDTAVELAMALSSSGADTTIIHRRDVFRASEENT